MCNFWRRFFAKLLSFCIIAKNYEFAERFDQTKLIVGTSIGVGEEEP